MLRHRLLILPVLLALAVSACGGKDKEAAATPAAAAATPTPTDAPPGKVEVTGKLGAKPKITITPTNPTPPSQLVVKDLVKGHGKAAKAGDTVTVQYDGVRGDREAAPVLRTAVNAWLWFMDGAILDWVEHRDIDRQTLHGLLLGTLLGAVMTAGEAGLP
jgi:ABC-type glycerol-3-phosphate transport system substrate-binding protein